MLLLGRKLARSRQAHDVLMEGRPVISDKCDVAAAAKLVGLGYPAVGDILPELFTWIQDGNWPVAQIVEFETELWRMANSPSEAERLEEIDKVAVDVLECLASRRGK